MSLLVKQSIKTPTPTTLFCKICNKEFEKCKQFCLKNEVFCSIQHLQEWREKVLDPLEEKKNEKIHKRDPPTIVVVNNKSNQSGKR